MFRHISSTVKIPMLEDLTLSKFSTITLLLKQCLVAPTQELIQSKSDTRTSVLSTPQPLDSLSALKSLPSLQELAQFMEDSYSPSKERIGTQIRKTIQSASFSTELLAVPFVTSRPRLKNRSPVELRSTQNQLQ